MRFPYRSRRLVGLVVFAVVLLLVDIASPAIAPADAEDVATSASWPVGADAALALDANGFAYVAFTTFNSLYVLRCFDTACDASTTAVVEGPYDLPSIAIDSTDRAVIAARHRDDRQLVVFACETEVCTSLSEPSRPATDLEVVAPPSLILDAQDRPIIAAIDQTTYSMRIISCVDALCSGAATIASPASAVETVAASPIQLDANGRSVVTFIDAATNELLLLRCGDAGCTTGTTVVAVGTALSYQLSLKLSASNRPVISVTRYLGSNNEGIELRICDDPGCSTFVTTEIDTGVYDPSPTSLALDGNDFPVLAYFDRAAQDLRVTRCGDAACGARTTTTVDRRGFEGVHPSLALDAAGLPVIAHRSASASQLELLRCDDPNCEPGSAVEVMGDANCDGSLNILDAFITAQYVVELRGSAATCDDTVGTTDIALSTVTVGDEPVTIQNAFWVAQCAVELDNRLCPAD